MTASAPWSGHFWTIVPNLVHRFRPAEPPLSVPWSTHVRAHDAGPVRMVRLVGALCEQPGSDSIVVVVHGLGGAIASQYCVRAAHAIAAHGMSSLRIALRGADRSGEDFYHAGLYADLEAAFASPELARYAHIFVLGYSLGGHVSLHAAVSGQDPRVRAVAAVCAPLDLERSANAIDAPSRVVYRTHILKGLKEIYAAVARTRSVPTPMSRIERVRTIREWDTLTVVPRYGFASVDDYYARMSVGRQLALLQKPALLVQSRHDPMVPPWTVQPLLDGLQAALVAGGDAGGDKGVVDPSRARLTVRWVDAGGHVGFPTKLLVDGQEVASIESYVLDRFRTQLPVRARAEHAEKHVEQHADQKEQQEQQAAQARVTAAR